MSARADLEGVFRIGAWTVDAASGTVSAGDDSVRLEPRVMAVLLDLARHAGEVRAKNDIIEAVWSDTFVGEAALSRCVSELRRILGDDARNPEYIETLPKRGYRLLAPVQPAAAAAPAAGAPDPAEAESRPRWQTLLAAALVLFFFVVWWRSIPPEDDGAVATIAVLPLRALSGDPEQQFFAEGLTEQLIAKLAGLQTVRVTSGRAARMARDADARPGEIASALGVDAIIDGTVQRSADRTLVSLELVEGASGRLLWGGTYQERGDDWLEIEHEVATQASREIALVLLPDDERVAHVPPPEAQTEFERGRLMAARGGPVDTIRSVDHLRRALEIDPQFALAWAELAEVLAVQAWNFWSTPESAYAEARTAAHTALDLDPRLPEAHAVLAAIAAERNQDWPEAERRFRTAVQLQPPSAYARERYGRYLRRVGRSAEAVVQSAGALELAPGSAGIAVSHAWNLLLSGQTRTAAELLDEVVELDDSVGLAYAGICAIDNLEDRLDEALRSCGRAASLPGQELQLGARGYAEARSGDIAAATGTLAELRELDPAAAALARATVQLGLADTEAAIGALEEAAELRSLWLPAMLENPYLRSLRDEPRIRRLLDDMLVPGSRTDG
jgi:DNA-binding winged helix-turn-helix (wHTH) protein/TolB-like protein/Tfp pilus assembly protein PilF